jgi:outer membrane protein OmpA-like peptidoglycan-associated protein
LASKSEDPRILDKVMDLAPAASEDVTWSKLASSVTDPNSPLIATGKRMLSGLLGASESAVTEAVGKDSGLRSGVASTLMAVAAPMVLSFLGKRAHDQGMTATGLGNILQRESATIRSALPSGLNDLFWPRSSVAAASYPVVTEAVREKTSSSSWLAALAVAALVLGLVWLLAHGRRSTTDQIGSIATGTASRVSNLGDFIKQQLPNNVYLNIPERGVEARLLSFIQDNGRTVSETTWFDFDRLVFDTGSATLRPESQEQLNNIAAILAAYPNVRMKVGGYTDNVGGADRNLQLSRDRANTVVAELVRRGISPGRLGAEGYGEQYPVADNSTEQGRAQNRRVSMRVTQK